ncbi:hypothetical protein [Cohnella sp. GCM10027633]|uniref:hypothetical protein n=1 Tax=unclassified Cohnella TaxID=2636738 RepID=UPI00362D117B
MLLRQGQSIVLLSLTRNSADASSEDDWANIVKHLLLTAYPELGLRIEIRECGAFHGEWTEGGWLEAVWMIRPDWLVVPSFAGGERSEIAMTPERFRTRLHRLLADTSAHAKRSVLFSPIEADEADADADVHAQYAEIVHDAAMKPGCLYVDAKPAIGRARDRHAHLGSGPETAEARRADIETSLAYAFLECIGFRWVRY